MKNKENIMIRTKDNRIFFLNKKYLPQIAQLCKIFKTDVLKVNINKGNTLTLKEFSIAFCDQNYQPNIEFEILEPIIENGEKKEKENKQEVLVRKNIYKLFKNHKIINLEELTKKYSETSPKFIEKIIKNLLKDYKKLGYEIYKIGKNKWQIGDRN